MNFQGKPKKYLITFLKVIGWITLTVLGLLVIVALAIQIPYVRNKLTQTAISFLEEKIGTEVGLEKISLSIPKKIVLTGLYLEDQKKDTLIYAGELAINTDLWALTKHTIQLNDIELSDFKGSVNRSDRDSSFNFDYIVEAFAGDSTAAPDTTQAPWKFTVGDILLEKIQLRFNDELLGNQIALALGTLELEIKQLDLERSTFEIGEINIENVKTSISQSKVTPDTVSIESDTTHQAIPFDIDIGAIALKSIEASYNHRGTGQVIQLNLGEFTLNVEDIDLKNNLINLDKLLLHDTFFSMHQMAGYPPEKTKTDTVKSNAVNPWRIIVGEVDLSDNSFQLHDFDKPFLKGQFDVNHLWITNLNAEANDLEWSGSNMRGELEKLAFKDRSGFLIESFATSFALSDTAVQISNFKFASPYSKIDFNGQAKFTSLKTISDSYPDTFVKLALEKSVIGLKDVHFFYPALLDNLPLTIPSSATVAIDTEIEGYLKNLAIDHLTISTLSKTHLDAQGNIQLKRVSDPYMTIKLRKFYTTKIDIASIVPDTLIPTSLALPEWLNITADIKGTINSPTLASIVTSNLGRIDLAGELARNQNTGKSKYKAAVKLKEFQAGKLLKQEATMGAVTLTASAAGSGLTMEEMNTNIKLQIYSFLYQDYLYKDFTLDGKMQKYFFSGEAHLKDENLDLNLKGDLDYNETVPKYNFTFELTNADFKALHLSERPLKARGTLDVNLATSDFKVINGNFGIRKFAIFNGKDMYAVDSLLFASIDQEGQSEISIRSDILDGNFEGMINLYSLHEVIRRHFNNYFSLQDTAFDKPAQPQDFKFDLTIKNTDLLTEIIIPELDPFIPGEIKGSFDSKAKKMDLAIDLAKIRYSGIGTDSIMFNITSNAQRLDYTLGVRKILMDTLRIEALKLNGSVANDSIRTKLTILDSLQKDKYVLGGVFHSLEKVFQFKFLPDEVIMNYAPWTTPPDNSLQFTSKGIQAHNFSITNINEMIGLKTSNDADSTVSIVFKDLNLQNITKLVEGTTPIDGLANGDYNMMVSKKAAFNSTLRIDKLKLLDHQWGDLSLALGQTSGGPLNIDLRLESDNTSLKAAGYYSSNLQSPEINFTAEILKFDLSSIEPLAMGQLKNTKGNLKGEVKITGSAKQPDIEGELKFINASFTPSMVNSKFTLEDETITIQNDEIILSDFEIKDSDNNVARLDGKIVSKAFQDFNLNLGLSATNFRILNSTSKDNELFYGKVSVSTKAKITGSVNQPVIDMNINLSDDSDFTYVVPQSEKGVLDQKGIVVFVDRDAKNDPFLTNINPRDTIKSAFRGIDLSANIELNDKETFNIIIDPATGDKLSVKGNSTLTLDIDPTGDMVLSGRYEISEGSYDLSFYKIVKRKFLIEKGSTIIWAGSPVDATLNLRAIFEVETSPIELIAAQTEDTEQLNTYKQRLPFLVYLQIKGELLTPEISFLLDMPEDKRNALGGVVYAKIRDINTRESELNKQVFALLVLKRFISENPLDNQAGSDVEGTARRSVSKLLTEQLNRLSENVKGVELSFDVKSYEDYSTGSGEGQTQLQLGLSKSLLDDRLIVKVAGNFEVEGESQNSASDYIGDLALEYKLTEDGRFRITGFRKTNFDMISGELIETGVGLIYIKDYNTLRELFKSNAKD